MKVNDKSGLERADAATGTKSAAKKSGAKAEKSEGGERLGSAKVELSGRAQDMKKIRDIVDAGPDVDEARVAKFKALVNSGQYKPSSEGTADKMVNEFAYQSILEE